MALYEHDGFMPNVPDQGGRQQQRWPELSPHFALGLELPHSSPQHLYRGSAATALLDLPTVMRKTNKPLSTFQHLIMYVRLCCFRPSPEDGGSSSGNP